MYQQFDPFFALLFPRLLSFIENRKKIQSNHLLRYKPNIYKRHVLQSSSLLLASLVNTIPQRPVLCDSLPFSSNTSSTPESLQQELIDFCNKHSIPNECRPKWTKLKEFDSIQFMIPSPYPIYEIISSIAEYRTTGTRNKSGSPSSSSSFRASNSVSIESRSVGNQSRIRLVITPRTPLTDELQEPATIIEVASTNSQPAEGSHQFTSIELKKSSGHINIDDIHTVELALYLGHVKSPFPSTDQSIASSKSELFDDPFFSWFRPSFPSRRYSHKSPDPFENDFFGSIQSSFFGPDIFSLFGSFPSDVDHFNDESFSLGRPMRSIDFNNSPIDERMKQRQLLMNNDDQKIKQKLETMGTKVYLPSDEREILEWGDLAGYEDAKRLIEETLLLGLTHPEVFNEVTSVTRGKPGESSRPRMILFNGPPGTGKTSTARIIASQVKLPLIYVSLESIVSKWFGESERNLGTIFDLARSLGQLHNGCVIFVDEIDSLAGSRDDFTSHEASRRILSILLRRLDGFDTQKDKTVLICATNRERDLDEAFRSRVDVTVPFPLPDFSGRCHIIKRYAKHLTDEEVETLAGHTTNLSGRNVRDLCQIAERKWVAQLLRESGTITSVADSPSNPKSLIKPQSGQVNFAVSPPPLEFYLAAAEQKQTQQT